MEFPMPGAVKPVSAVEYANQYADLSHKQQQGRLIDMQIEQAPQELALKQQKMQQELQTAQQSDSLKKHAAISGLASDLLRKMEAQGITDQQQQEQFSRQYQQTMRPYVQNVLGLPGNGDMSLDQIKMIAGSAGTAGGYHPPVATNQGTLQYGDNGWEPIKIGKNVAMPVGADVGLQGSIAGAKSANEYVVIDGRAYQKGDISAGGMPSAPQAPQQPQTNVDISPNASPEDRAMLEQIAQQKGVQPSYGESPQRDMPMTPEQKAQLETQTKLTQEQGKADIESKQKVSQQQNQKEYDAKDAIGILDQAEPLLEKTTNSGIGADYDKAAAYFGNTTGGANAASELATLGGLLISKMPRMSGPQSDKDVLLYEKMAGRIGDPSIPKEQRKAALRTIRLINEQYAGKQISGPKSGDVEDGYRFKGGDKADPNNWEKI